MNLHSHRRSGARRLLNARMPPGLVHGLAVRETDTATGLALVDIGIDAAGLVTADEYRGDTLDLQGRIVLPTFVDSHVHLDKAYIVGRTGLPAGGLLDAVKASIADAANRTPDDLEARMRKALDRAYRHGTSAMRTHLDTPDMPAESASWRVFDALRSEWRDRIALQAVALMALERVESSDFGERCRQIAALRGVLGAFIGPGTASPERLNALFRHAAAAALDVDFHVDETLDPGANGLELIAESVLRTGFEGRVLAGHCCALGAKHPDERDRVLDKVAAAGIHVVALPNSNLFLQDRALNSTPLRRGVTTVREMRARGIAVHFASDNVQDPFFPFGDFDMLDIFRAAVGVAHLDRELGDWAVRIFRDAAFATGFDQHGRIAPGRPADLVIFEATGWYDLLGQSQSNRLVCRDGAFIHTSMSSLREEFAVEFS